jgi:hypothetical protein
MPDREHDEPGSSADSEPITGRSQAVRKVDGRSAGAVRFRRLVAGFKADLGDVELSQADLVLVETAAVAAMKIARVKARMIAGEDVSTDELTRLVGNVKRVMSAISVRAGENKVAVDPMAAYLARRAAADDDTDEDTDQ